MKAHTQRNRPSGHPDWDQIRLWAMVRGSSSSQTPPRLRQLEKDDQKNNISTMERLHQSITPLQHLF
jgi:hypothetical protein